MGWKTTRFEGRRDGDSAKPLAAHAFVSMHDAQMLLGDSLPVALRGRVDPYQLITGVVAYGKPGANLDALADRITSRVPAVKATKPSDLVSSFKSGGAIFTFMTTAAALLALIIGGLSVVNTMIMSVTERVSKIGLKKAIGARTRTMLSEFLAEATATGSSVAPSGSCSVCS